MREINVTLRTDAEGPILEEFIDWLRGTLEACEVTGVTVMSTPTALPPNG